MNKNFLKIFLGRMFLFRSFAPAVPKAKPKTDKALSLECIEIPEEPEYGGSLVLASIGEPSNLIPILAADSASHEIAGFLYTSLLKYDKEYNIVPLAAKKFEILEEGRLFRFELRDDIYWQDGTQLTADDVYFTYRLTIDPDTPTPYAADCLLVKEFKQTGKSFLSPLCGTVCPGCHHVDDGDFAEACIGT